MKIGFNIASISNLDSLILKNDNKFGGKKIVLSEKLKKTLNYLKENNHEIYMFYPIDGEMIDKIKLKIKKNLIRKLASEGYDFNQLVIINDLDMVDSIKRNHVDISVLNDNDKIEKVNQFANAISFEENENYDDLLDKIIENIDKNYQTVIPEDSKPQGLPSEDKLWLKNYRVGDYRWINESMSPYERLVEANKDFPDSIAIEYFGNKYTTKEFIKKIDEFYERNIAGSIWKGMVVPIVVANTPESLFTLYALFKAKATIAPIFPLSTKEDFKEKLNSIVKKNKENFIESNYIFMSDIVYGRLKDVVPENTTVVVLPVSESMPLYLKIAFDTIVKPKMKIEKVKYDSTFVHFRNFKKLSVEQQPDISFDNSYAAVQLFTGGSIQSKGVLLSEENLDNASKQFYNDRFDFKRGDKIAAFMPLNHSFGLIIGTHVAATLGVNLDVIMKIDFKRLDKLFIKDGVNLFGGIPNMFPAMRDNKYMENADLSHVKYVLSGGAAIDDSNREATNKFLEEHNSNARVQDGYGLTETAGGILYNGIPNMNTLVKIIDPETNKELGYNQVGELCFSGKQIMIGYTDEELTLKKLRHHEDGNVWLHTGDLAVIDNNGYIKPLGRMDRMIKVNGEQVLLDDIEKVIVNALPFVQQCCVVGQNDGIRGKIPVAFIKLNSGYVWNDEIEKQLNELYLKKFNHFTAPKHTYCIENFPLTKVGKISLKELEDMANNKSN